MGHHQLPHDPLVPGMPPALTRVLAVGGDTARLDRLVANLRLRGYQAVTSSTDPAVAMAGLRLQEGSPQGFSFDVVMVDTSSQYPGGGAALQLFEFAVRQPQLCAYAVPEDGKPFGPLEMNDLNISRKSIYNVESNGPKSPHVAANGPHNNSQSMTSSKIANSASPGGRARRNNKKQACNVVSEEEEQQQPAEKPQKPRVVWTDELHKKFVEAHDELATSGDAVPKKILALMGDSTLTRENIASHLQKHRLNLTREAYTYPLRRGHSRTKHHRSKPQASFPSPNMPQQQAPPTVMQSQSATVYANHLVIHFQTLTTTDKSNESMLVDVPPKDMYPGDDDTKQDSMSCIGYSDGNSTQEDGISEILNKEPEPSWDEAFLSNGD
ncbi:unnamed protein product [Alopecurus aequalis]